MAASASTTTTSTAIPRLGDLDATLRFRRDGYAFGTRGFREVGTDAFRTRILGRDVVVLRGVDAARFFYEGDRFTRAGALPQSVKRLLQDDGSVQTLDGIAHRPRKALFLDLAAHRGRRGALAEAFRREWDHVAVESAGRPVSLIDASALALTRAVLHWAGIEVTAHRAAELSAELLSMVDNAGRFGPPNWIATARRRGTERWARDVVERIRATEYGIGRTPVERIALHRELAELLPPEVAAVELLNLLRPTVAVAHYVAFAAHALHFHPSWRARLSSTAPDRARAREAFAQEVRRRYPFFPMVGGRAIHSTVWAGERLRAGQWVLLDLYGTDHAPTVWERPDEFDPERFLGRAEGADAPPPVVAQGAGDAARGHHCPGEPATVDLIAASLDRLVDGPGYSVPEQDLRVSLRRRFPARPEGGMLVQFAR